MSDASAMRDPGQRGFSYVEVLLSVILVAVLLVPALQALQSGVSGGQSAAIAARQAKLQALMEQVLAKPFYDLYAQTYTAGNSTSANATYSDSSGSDPRVVVLYRYDPTTNALSNNDTGLLYVSVYYQADGSASGLNTLVGRWW
jgi:type II secretory pathway pseudopilin PulG